MKNRNIFKKNFMKNILIKLILSKVSIYISIKTLFFLKIMNRKIILASRPEGMPTASDF